MQNKPFFMLLLLVSFLLVGAITRQYVHEQGADGSAVLTVKMKTAALGAVDYEKIANLCPQYKCSIDKDSFSISAELTKGPYYKFYNDYGFPYITYTLEINAIPDDVLAEKTAELLKAAGENVGGGVEASDITAKNTELADMLRRTGDMSYTVVMPGEVTETSVGQKNGNTASFMLSQAYAQGGPVVIKSRQLNTAYLLGALLIIALIILSAYFFLQKRETGQKEVKSRQRKR